MNIYECAVYRHIQVLTPVGGNIAAEVQWLEKFEIAVNTGPQYMLHIYICLPVYQVGNNKGSVDDGLMT